MIKTVFRTLIIGALSLSAYGVQAQEQQQNSSFSKQERNEINNLIHDYILEHPEILPQAIQILQQKQKLALWEQNKKAIYDDGFSPVEGNPNGDVTVVEF